MLPPSVMGRPASNPADDPMIKLLTRINEGQEKQFGALAKLLSIEENQLKAQEDSARAEEEAAQAASDAAADAARKTRLQQVAEKGAAAGKKAVETAKDVKKGGEQFVKDRGGLAMTIAKGLGLALAAPAIKEFALNVKGGVEQKLDENGDVISNTFSSALKFDETGKGSLWAILGGLISKKLILPGFLAGALSEKMKNIDLPISDQAASNIGVAIGGALGFALPKLIVKNSKKLFGKVVDGFKPSTVVPPTTPPATPPASSTSPRPTTPPASSTSPKPTTGGVGSTPKPTNIPSSMKVNSAGRVIDAGTGRFQSAQQVADALKAEGRAATLAKYAKFLKFAGPAMAVIPSLIDPIMAIYNDAPEEEVKKQIIGALGSISGATLGAIGGAAMGSAVPGAGTLIGGLAGAFGGAILGEGLAEELADWLLGTGPAPDPNLVKIQTKRGTRFKRLKPGDKGYVPLAGVNAGADAGPNVFVPPEIVAANQANSAVIAQGGGAFSGGAPMRPDLMVNAGGNNTNNTSVGGSSTIFNIVNGGNNSLMNSHLPVPQ